jgi:hypothetical protein
VCIAAVFCGTSKPGCLDLYLQPLINELNALKETGIVLHGKLYTVQVLGFSCDAPARAYLKCVKGHTGFYGCEKCSQKGKTVDGNMTFPDLSAAKRTDEFFFMQQKQKEHRKGVSPLLELQLGLVSRFPLDYMHLICLGFVNKLIMYWLHGKRAVRVGPTQRQIISDGIVRLAPFLCEEFSRKLCPLKEIERWKAVEFRTFLLYVGPLVMRPAIPSALYHHFMLLNAAVTILTNSNLCHRTVDYADTLLRKFVSESKVLYGPESLVYNMHNLIHVCDDVKKFGLLDDFSCFQFDSKLDHLKRKLRSGNKALAQNYGPESLVYNMHNLIHVCDDVKKFGLLDDFCCFQFESKLDHLKRKLRSGNKALAQLCRRESETQTSGQLSQLPDTVVVDVKQSKVALLKERFDGPTAGYSGQQYCRLIYGSYVLDTEKSSDFYALTAKGEVVQIINIISDIENIEVHLICKRFKDSDNFFDYPCESKKLNVRKVSNLSKSYIVVSSCDIDCKCVVFKRKSLCNSIAALLICNHHLGCGFNR